MADDVFLNLVAQSLNSSVEIRPLIAPLFAPAPQLVSEGARFAGMSEIAEPAVAAEAPPSSIYPETIAHERPNTWEMESPFRETIPTETRPILPDLIPAHISEQSIPILSIRHLLRSQPSSREKVASGEQTIPPDVIADTSEIRPSSTHHENQPARNAWQSEAAKQQSQALSARKSATPKPQTPPSESSSKPTVEREESTPTSSRPSSVDWVQPIMHPTMQPLLSASSLLPQPSLQPEQYVHTDDVLAQQPLSSRSTPQKTTATVNSSDQQSVMPLPDKTSASALKPLQDQLSLQDHKSEPGGKKANRLFTDTTKQVTQLAVTPITEPLVQPVIASGTTSIAQTPVMPLAAPAYAEMPSETRSGRNETQASVTIERNSRLSVSTTATEPAERIFIPSSPIYSPDALSVPPVVARQEAHAAEQEVETPPVRVTIGRVVVRATPPVPPAPTQKRVLRPAQSLSEYLKQRERGSR